MKTNIWKLAVAGAAALALLAGCQKPENQAVTPKVSISATPSFTNGAATLTLTLSAAATSEVTVTLGVEGTIPTANITYTNTVKFAAGSTSQTVPVTVKTDGLAGGSYVASFSIKSATGAEVGSPSDASVTLTVTEEATPSVVNITASDAEFVNNKATLTITLDKAQKDAVSVTLAIAAEVEGYTAIPAEALTLENPVTFVAGETSKVISITADPAKLPAGESWTVISIASVSSNATIGNKKSVYIMATNAMEAKLREDWTVAYVGEEEYEGEMYSVIDVDGLGENGTYYIFIYAKGTVADNFETVTEYLQFMEDNLIAPTLGTADAYQIKDGDTGWLYYQFAVGEYEIWLAGCNAAGHLTGEYTTNTFTIEPSDEMKAAYPKFLGEWILENPRTTWTITEKVFGSTYTITGMEGQDIPVEAHLNENLELEIYAQENLDDNYQVTYQNQTFDCVLNLYGIDNGEGYYWTGEYLIATGTLDEDGNVVLTPGTVSDGSKTYDLAYMIFIAEDKKGQGAFSITDKYPALPNYLINPNNVQTEDTPVVKAAYSDFLGAWNIDGYEFNVLAGSDESTYVFSIGEGYEAVAKFEDGTMTLYDQTFGAFQHQSYGACSFMIGGIFVYSGTEYMYYYYNNNGDFSMITKIFTAQMHQSGNITFIPGSCEYGDYIGFAYRWWITEPGESYGLGNWMTETLHLDVVVTPIVEELQAPKAPLAARGMKLARPAEKVSRPQLHSKVSVSKGERLSKLF